MSRDTSDDIQLGFVTGAHGVNGWIRVYSFTEPRENVVAYGAWSMRQDGATRQVDVVAGQPYGKTVIAKLDGIDDRDSAEQLTGAEIFVPRSALPDCGPREYYWADLEGLRVIDQSGAELGRVDRLIATGAHDVLVLAGKPERLIPFVLDRVVTDVDLAAGTITVNWDAGFWEE